MKLVLWDIDGTLVDTAGYGRHAFEAAFREVLGRPMDMDVPFGGYTDHQIALAVLERNGVSDGPDHLPRVLEVLADALAEREHLIAEHGRALEGVPEALAAIAARDGVVQSLLTGNVEANAAVKLAPFGLGQYLDFEVGAYGSDPHAARSDLVAVAIEKTTSKYGVEVPARDVWLIGDTPRDVDAAHDAGARVVAVDSGFAEPGSLEHAGADAFMHDLRDTAALLQALGLD